MRIHPVMHPRFPIAVLVGLAAVSLFAQITLVEQGRAAISRGDSDAAISYFGQYRASVEKNYAAGFAELEAALKVDPSYMPAYYHLGRAASLANRNLTRGEEALEKYLAYRPKQNEPTLASAHYFLGDIYEKQGRKAEAKQAYQAALKLNPTLTRASEALKRVS